MRFLDSKDLWQRAPRSGFVIEADYRWLFFRVLFLLQ